MTEEELCIGTVTAGRPRAIQRLIQSIQENIDIPVDVLVVDNDPTEGNKKIYNKNDINFIVPETRIGPSESRRIIADEIESPYLLYLDDDLIVKENTVTEMLENIKSSDSDMVSGIWKESGGYYREIGHYFTHGRSRAEEAIIKFPVGKNKLDGEDVDKIRAHSGMASVLVDTEIFDTVMFDPEYDFFYEWWDFFLQCYQNDVELDILMNAEFRHDPIDYEGSTIRQEQNRQVDKSYFESKWDMTPIVGGAKSRFREDSSIFDRIYSKVDYLKI